MMITAVCNTLSKNPLPFRGEGRVRGRFLFFTVKTTNDPSPSHRCAMGPFLSPEERERGNSSSFLTLEAA